MVIIPPEELINYKSLVKEATHEYHDLVDYKRPKTATVKENSQEKLSLQIIHCVN